MVHPHVKEKAPFSGYLVHNFLRDLEVKLPSSSLFAALRDIMHDHWFWTLSWPILQKVLHYRYICARDDRQVGLRHDNLDVHKSISDMGINWLQSSWHVELSFGRFLNIYSQLSFLGKTIKLDIEELLNAKMGGLFKMNNFVEINFTAVLLSSIWNFMFL